MLAAKVKIPQRTGYSPIVPVVIPNLQDVRLFAGRLHEAGEMWQGEIFGWQAEYIPQSAQAPEESKMKFTPADFWIGESGIWFFSQMWENGADQPPVEFLDERGLVK